MFNITEQQAKILVDKTKVTIRCSCFFKKPKDEKKPLLPKNETPTRQVMKK